jgi:hypothetical protein
MTYRKLLLFLGLCLLSGCALTRQTVTIHDVVLLPEERIFSIPAGQLINVELDGKPMQMTFPHPMKLVYESVLVRQEEKLNNQIMKTTKATKQKNQIIGIIASILGIVGTIFWNNRRKFKLEGNIKAEA